MALELIQEDHFQIIKNILLDSSIEDSCLIKRGLKRAAEVLNISIEPGAVIPVLTVK
jgi:hypothetical protein